MSYVVTNNQISAFVPRLSAGAVGPLVAAINATNARFQIDQAPRRVRYFVAQSAFETASFTSWSEDLVYTTPERLVEVWPSRFTLNPNDSSKAFAPAYTNNPQALANLVYASRDGNGGPDTGDGWNFRGRGGFDLTGRSNYTEYSQDVYGDQRIVANPDLVLQPTDAMMSAGWFWGVNGLNAHADADEFTTTTTIINGNASTVDQRLAVLNQVNAIFQW